MFPKSARFNNQVSETPGPGNYEPKAQRRASGIVSFAADGIQRFAADKEQDSKLGPGYYSTPLKPGNFAKRRVSHAPPSMFKEAHRKLEQLNGTCNSETSREVVNELSAAVRKYEKDLEAETARAMAAQTRCEVLQALCEQEVATRHEIEQQLAAQSQETSEAKAKFEEELKQHDEKIESLERQIQEFEEYKAQAQGNISALSSQIAELEGIRETILAEHAAQLTTLQAELQTCKQEAQLRHAEMEVANRELSKELHNKREIVSGLEAQIDSTQKTLTASQTACEEAQQQIRGFKEHKEQAEENISALNFKIAELEATSQNLSAERDVIAAQFTALQTEFQVSKDEAQRRDTENKDFSQHQQQVASDLEAQISSTQQLLAASQAECQRVHAQIRGFEEHKAQAEDYVSTLTSKIVELEETRQGLSEERDKFVTQLAVLQLALQASKEEAQAHATELETKNGELLNELQSKQQTVCNLEAKITSTQLMLTTSQAACQEAQQQLDEMSQANSTLESTLATKEQQHTQLLVEFKARSDKLGVQLKKKNETILGLRSQIDKLNQEQQHLQHQKLTIEKQFNTQIQLLQDELRTAGEHAKSQAAEYQVQITEAQAKFDIAQTSLAERISSLASDLATAEAKIDAMQTEARARNEEILSMNQAKQDMMQQFESQSKELSSWQSKAEATQQMFETESQARSDAEKALEREKFERAEEVEKHMQGMQGLQETIHQNQETREQLFAKLGNAEMQSQDMLIRAQTAEELAAKKAALVTEYESKLNSEIARCENYMVQLANVEMEQARVKGELASAEQLIAELRERFLTEQALASEFESKFNTESSNATDLRQMLLQSEQQAANHKGEILSLTTQLEGRQSALSELQLESDLRQNSHRSEVSALNEELRVATEKNVQLTQSLDEQAYQCSVVTRQKEEEAASKARLEATTLQLKDDLASQTAGFQASLQEKDIALQALQEKFEASASSHMALTEEIEALKRAQSIEKLATERAVHAVMANLELQGQDLSIKASLCEKQGLEIEKLEQARELAVQSMAALQQELKQAKDTKEETATSYKSLLSSFDQTTEELEKKEAAFAAMEAQSKASMEALEKQKEAMTHLAQENKKLANEVERLAKFAEENSEAIATVAALRAKVAELEASNKDLRDSFTVLEHEAEESAEQTTKLVGHSNQKQRINILAKAVAENRKLKLEKIQLANELHDLKKAKVGSSVVSDVENVAPTPSKEVCEVLKPTPASRAKTARKLDVEEDENPNGPLQQSFRAWQQKRQRAEASKRTPLAPLR